MKKIITFLSLSLLFWPLGPVLAADTTRPTVGAPLPEQATVGVAVTVTASVSDDESGMASCNLYINNNDVGSMALSPNTANKSYTFFQAGIHTMFVFCRDMVNNFQSGPNTSVFVTPAPGSHDSTPPVVSEITPASAIAGQSLVISVSASDGGTGISSCQLVVDELNQFPMEVTSGGASIAHTFDIVGNYEVYAQCFDGAGNAGSGEALTFMVTPLPAPQPTPTPTPEPPPIANPNPRLIKLACPATSTPDHPCRAVYYHGQDNKRHAFPNAKVYFSWYGDFAGVQEISSLDLSAIAFGHPVHYRPGYTLVKFSTLNNVYAVSRGGVLRWITSETTANSLYGSQWNKMVHDIPDTFFLDYTLGADITTSLEYSPAMELTNTTTIDADFSATP